jgi:predicted GH43/DUF377 family glycosyl hydrolase
MTAEAAASPRLAADDDQKDALARRQPDLLRPDPTRTVLRPFIIEDETGDCPRTRRVIERVLTLDLEGVQRGLDAVNDALDNRHPHAESIMLDRYEQMKKFAPKGAKIDRDQAKLIGAYFSEEYSFESAALFNPSVVRHPDQSGVEEGDTRILLSLRGIGEGHISSLTFRCGLWKKDGTVETDKPSDFAIGPRIERSETENDQLLVHLIFDDIKDLSEPVIYPFMPSQGRGLEDCRLVEFTDDDGKTDYRGTYTAFDGSDVRQGLLRTSDFRTYEMRGVQGDHYSGKGMALFPRRIDGRYVMLSRQDNENLFLVYSDDPYNWNGGEKIIEPEWPWEFIQIGNCGSPIELDEGWLVITHGVGAARNYCVGACLLDKQNPAKVLKRMSRPVLEPLQGSRDGYVPNVVYSCGALLRGRTLLLPYGVADNYTAFSTVDVDALLAAME